jgi:hypothetical protein
MLAPILWLIALSLIPPSALWREHKPVDTRIEWQILPLTRYAFQG